MYQRIEGSQWRHIWLTGDVHGCYARLIAQLKSLKFNPYEDLLLSVGDLIDRGPESRKCLTLIEQKWFAAIRGNHEQMAMDALSSRQLGLWALNGGDWFSRSSSAEKLRIVELLEACRRLPYVLEVRCRSGVSVVAHADYPADEYRWQQPVDGHRVLWDRQRLTDHLAGRHTSLRGAEHFWFGHTPLKQRYDFENQHYIDTGAVFGGVLTLVQLQ
ncbi:protein-serine/threonine phosphatase [[Enterobacter] lignolyticus]|uniref:Serine/threonine protein phosphatase n=1 Tax=[Enterobacter] lignolyticus TaxID=1334193 RepID=A0A806X5X7_9ENTR|nr:protein-serine/threonine phosphatase [[Enterobacter] lignolyticus]ALR77068.1 serine/threonine protein phosphatase [[Enterobacter] lignolyticus]